MSDYDDVMEVIDDTQTDLAPFKKTTPTILNFIEKEPDHVKFSNKIIQSFERIFIDKKGQTLFTERLKDIAYCQQSCHNILNDQFKQNQNCSIINSAVNTYFSNINQMIEEVKSYDDSKNALENLLPKMINELKINLEKVVLSPLNSRAH